MSKAFVAALLLLLAPLATAEKIGKDPDTNWSIYRCNSCNGVTKDDLAKLGREGGAEIVRERGLFGVMVLPGVDKAWIQAKGGRRAFIDMDMLTIGSTVFEGLPIPIPSLDTWKITVRWDDQPHDSVTFEVSGAELKKWARELEQREKRERQPQPGPGQILVRTSPNLNPSVGIGNPLLELPWGLTDWCW